MYYSVIQAVLVVTKHCSLAVVTLFNMGTLLTLQVTTPNKFTVAFFGESNNLPTEASVATHNIAVLERVWFSITLPSSSPQRTIMCITITISW